jgi:hypothetical protein
MVADRKDLRITYRQSSIVSKRRMRCQEAVQPVIIIYAVPLPSPLPRKHKKEINERNLVKLVAIHDSHIQTRIFFLLSLRVTRDLMECG